MGLEKVRDILAEAKKDGYAVLAFNAFDYGTITWPIEAAEEANCSIIIQLYPLHTPSLVNGRAFADMVKSAAAKAKVPVGIHLDHCGSFEAIMGFIRDGITSVMYDGSHHPFDENVRNTTEIVRVAHAMDIDVEAELGAVGRGSNLEDFNDTSAYTKPEDAKRFIELTGVDSLAVAIGNAHGNYIAEPKLDLDLLDRINKAVSIPLVLHGGSGIPDDQLRKAASVGICKLNVATESFQLWVKLVGEAMKDENKKSSIDIIPGVKEKMKEYYKKKILLMKE